MLLSHVTSQCFKDRALKGKKYPIEISLPQNICSDISNSLQTKEENVLKLGVSLQSDHPEAATCLCFRAGCLFYMLVVSLFPIVTSEIIIYESFTIVFLAVTTPTRLFIISRSRGIKEICGPQTTQSTVGMKLQNYIVIKCIYKTVYKGPVLM